MKLRRVLRWLLIGTGALLLLAAGAAVAAYYTMLPLAPGRPDGAPASPPVLGAFGGDGPVRTVGEWRERRAPELQGAFQVHVYGRTPASQEARLLARKPVRVPELDGAARFEQLTVEVGRAPASARVNVVLMTPARPGRHPLILMQNFCGNRAAVPGRPMAVEPIAPPPAACLDPAANVLTRTIFGRHAAEPPWSLLAARGYAAATFYAGDMVPDAPGGEGADAALARLQPGVPAADRGGALAVWAWGYSRVLDVLEQQPGVDPGRTAVWGHSRNGKAALLAAALDPEIDLVIAHQSGRGGAALTRSAEGESVKEITDGYPHWFGSRFAGYAGREAALPVDQHQLIALIAPRPVLLGAARRDAWSDPAGAFRALQGAAPAYALHAAPGLKQAGMAEPEMDGRLATFMRPGRHGVTAEDWRRFLQFTDAHFKPAD